MSGKLSMLTIPRKKQVPIPGINDKPDILKRKVITYPKTFSKTVPISDLNELKEEKKDYETTIETIDAAKEIADFEKRVLGVRNPKYSAKIPNIDTAKFDKLKDFGPPSITRCYELFPSSMSCPTSGNNSSRVRSTLNSATRSCRPSRGCPCCSPDRFPDEHVPKKISTKPSSWNILDELDLPSQYREFPIPEISNKPFYRLAGTDNSRGIPILNKRVKAQGERKVEKYNERVRLELTIDHQKREEKIRNEAKSTLESLQRRTKETDELYMKSGQGWCLEEIKKRKTKPKKEKEVKIPEEDLMALKELEKRDQDIRYAYKEQRKKEIMLGQ